MIRLAEYETQQNLEIRKFVKKAVKDRKNLQKHLKAFFIAITLLGVSSGNAEIDKLAKKNFSERTVNTLRITLSDIQGSKGIIDRATEFWDDYTLNIVGDFEKDRLEASERIFQSLIQEGYTQAKLQKELAKALEIDDAIRLEKIAITETTKCFNHARVEVAKENAANGGIVRGVRFVAVMDGHQSEICRLRHNKVLAIDDPRIDENTPPMHVRCRSLLVYIDKWDWEELYGGTSSSEWDSETIKESHPGSTWGNAFAYSGKRTT